MDALVLQGTGPCSAGVGIGNQAPEEDTTFTEYVSAGRWQAQLDGYRSFWQSTRHFAAGRNYTDTFGGAVFGPGQDFPNVQQDGLSFYPEGPISDPEQDSFVCCDVSRITLSSGGHVVKTAVLSEWKQLRAFGARLHSSPAWYTMRVLSRRRVPGVKTPPGILSPQVLVVWHFRAGPVPLGNYGGVEVPVTATRYVPQGLNLQNQAAPDSATVLGVHVDWASQLSFKSARRSRLTTVLIQFSVNDGKTWQTVRLARHGSGWLATIPDPGSGYVSLRSTVIDSRGDSTVETIDRAYAIS